MFSTSIITTLQFKRLALNDSINNLVAAFRSHIVNPAAVLKQHDSKDKYYANYLINGKNLFEKLLKPVLKNKSYKKITIIPDGVLCYIPFEVLPTNMSQGQNMISEIRLILSNHYKPAIHILLPCKLYL